MTFYCSKNDFAYWERSGYLPCGSHILRYSEITLASGEKIKDGRGLKEILSQLEDAPFVQIDRGASVNLDYVRQIKGNCVLLSTGESLSISRQKLAAVKEAISRIWGNSL